MRTTPRLPPTRSPMPETKISQLAISLATSPRSSGLPPDPPLQDLPGIVLGDGLAQPYRTIEKPLRALILRAETEPAAKQVAAHVEASVPPLQLGGRRQIEVRERAARMVHQIPPDQAVLVAEPCAFTPLEASKSLAFSMPPRAEDNPGGR